MHIHTQLNIYTYGVAIVFAIALLISAPIVAYAQEEASRSEAVLEDNASFLAPFLTLAENIAYITTNVRSLFSGELHTQLGKGVVLSFPNGSNEDARDALSQAKRTGPTAIRDSIMSGISSNLGTFVVNTNLRASSDFKVAGNTDLSKLTVTGPAALSTLMVPGTTNLSDLTVVGATTSLGRLNAVGGITTNGAMIDLGGGEVIGTDLVTSIEAGENVEISGSTGDITISVPNPGITRIIDRGDRGSSVETINSMEGDLEITSASADQIAVTTDHHSNIILSLPQDIATASSPTFASLTLTGTLDVSGDTTISGVTRATSGVIIGGGAGDDPAAGATLEVASGDILFSTSGNITQSDATSAVSFAGDVGLGTTTPSYALDVQDGAGIVGQFSGRVIGANAVNSDEFVTLGQVDGSGGNGTIDVFVQDGNSFGELAVLGTNDTFGLALETDGTERIRIDASGQVGIGTTSPDGILDVEGDAKTIFLQPTDVTLDGGAKSSPTFTFTGKYDSDATAGVISTNRSVSFQNITEASGAYRVDVLDNAGAQFVTFEGDTGRVGIGTSAPGYAFDVSNGTANFGGDVNLSSATPTIAATAGSQLTINGNGTGTIRLADSSTGNIEFFGASNFIDSSGNFTIGGNFTLSGTAITANGELTVSSGGTSDLILDSASGTIELATGDSLETSGGYDLTSGNVFREVQPIFGFDVPVRCSTSCEDPTFQTVSRTIETYDFPTAYMGTTRQHNLTIRYADDKTTGSTNWRVYNDTAAAVADTFTVPASPTANLDAGAVYTTGDVAIPTNGDDWHLEVAVPATGDTVQVYQVFLGTYDAIN